MGSYDSLDALYAKIDNLPRQFEVKNLRESTPSVYAARQADSTTAKLEKKNRKEVPNTMVLHDMEKGLQDSISDMSHDPYIFYHWNMIDSFVCYSHKLITLPPYGLITAAHNHGVKILGTFTTEGKQGKRICEAILANEIERNKFLESLTRLAKFYKFDGWMLMIGNDIRADKIEDMITFVRELTNYIHTDTPGSEIIWYDTVSTLNAQRCTASLLNSYNENFFEVCDGIVLDFRYIDSFLTNRAALGYRNKRPLSVHIGVDVAGKRCPGGGGFNLAFAVDKIRRQGLSVAITNPNWTYNNFGSEKFLKIENIFWAQLLPHLFFHVPVYKKEIFQTSFCRGYGTKYYRNGKVEEGSGKPFYNLMWQKPQILAPGLHSEFTCIDIPESKENHVQKFETPFEKITVDESKITFVAKEPPPSIDYTEICNDYAWEGGSCLDLNFNSATQYHRLFLVQLEFDKPLEANLVYRARTTDVWQKDQLRYPMIVLRHDAGEAVMSPTKTKDLDSDWRKCTYETSLKGVNEIGVLLGVIGRLRLAEIVIQPIGAEQDISLPRPVTVLPTSS